jgi:hypothetical protein
MALAYCAMELFTAVKVFIQASGGNTVKLLGENLCDSIMNPSFPIGIKWSTLQNEFFSCLRSIYTLVRLCISPAGLQHKFSKMI